jgi:Tfp pilus assembly protein PilZ
MNASDRYQIQGASCLIESTSLPIANLSVGGLFAISEHPPIIGQVLSLDLSLPDQGTLHMQGIVSWIHDEAEPGGLPRGFGVKITHISFVDKLALLAFLRRTHAIPGSRWRRAQPQTYK